MSKNTIEYEYTSGLGWLMGLGYFLFLMYSVRCEPLMEFFGKGIPLFYLATFVLFTWSVFTIGSKTTVIEINRESRTKKEENTQEETTKS